VSELVEAAGGVVLRGAPGAREVLVVHRPDHADWTIPKGKLERAEDHAAAAVREVAEETGWRCTTGPWLPEVRYIDSRGRPKRVRFRVMRPVERDGWEPSGEVDEVRWLSVAAANEELSYPSDRDVLDTAVALDQPVYVVRHGKASSRENWDGDDDRRPLTGKGRRQAERLRRHLGLDHLRHVRSSPAVRCVQTVEPMAEDLELGVELADELREGTPEAVVMGVVRSIAGPSVLCTHGDVVVDVVQAVERLHPIEGSRGWKKGATWILERDAGEPIRARYVAPPRDRVA
jgi:8-oxo-dGTP pyrophosphatase MutT (NUDIX family)/phosphohistidine phosphatase SixA